MALPTLQYGLSNLYLFPIYQTREAYHDATGLDAPLYDPSKPIKSWFDPKALNDPKFAQYRKIIYDRVLALAENGTPLVDGDGKPFFEALQIDKTIAATVNIPHKAPGVPDEPTTGVEIPVPCRELQHDEELFFQFGGTAAVRNKTIHQAIEDKGDFTAEDRELLHQIAKKVGV